MKWQLTYTRTAVKHLKSLDQKSAQRIAKKLAFFITQKNPLVYAKKLTHPAYGEYRFRIGDYRVLFDVNNKGTVKILLILSIKHRSDMYKSL